MKTNLEKFLNESLLYAKAKFKIGHSFLGGPNTVQKILVNFIGN